MTENLLVFQEGFCSIEFSCILGNVESMRVMGTLYGALVGKAKE